MHTSIVKMNCMQVDGGGEGDVVDIGIILIGIVNTPKLRLSSKQIYTVFQFHSAHIGRFNSTNVFSWEYSRSDLK